MPKEPERELRVTIDKSKRQMEIILLADGSPLGSWSGSEEAARQHAMMVIAGIEMLQDTKGKSGLILPPH